jgi:hypothetical protein
MPPFPNDTPSGALCQVRYWHEDVGADVPDRLETFTRLRKPFTQLWAVVVDAARLVILQRTASEGDKGTESSVIVDYPDVV